MVQYNCMIIQLILSFLFCSGWIYSLSVIHVNLGVAVFMMVVAGFFTVSAVLSVILLKMVLFSILLVSPQIIVHFYLLHVSFAYDQVFFKYITCCGAVTSTRGMVNIFRILHHTTFKILRKLKSELENLCCDALVRSLQ